MNCERSGNWVFDNIASTFICLNRQCFIKTDFWLVCCVIFFFFLLRKMSEIIWPWQKKKKKVLSSQKSLQAKISIISVFMCCLFHVTCPPTLLLLLLTASSHCLDVLSALEVSRRLSKEGWLECLLPDEGYHSWAGLVELAHLETNEHPR